MGWGAVVHEDERNWLALTVAICTSYTIEQAFRCIEEESVGPKRLGKDIFEEDIEDIIKLRENQGLSWRDLGYIYNADGASIRYWVKKHQKKQKAG